jgi:hypothetical protein
MESQLVEEKKKLKEKEENERKLDEESQNRELEET